MCKPKLEILDFVNRANKIHNNIYNNIYNYSKSNFNSTHKKIIIICPKHGEFLQLVKNHLSGKKCPICSKNNRFITLQEFINRANKIHNNKFNYENSIYISSINKLKIKCKLCKNVFLQSPNNHLHGNGCPTCKNIKTSVRCSSTLNEFIKKSHKIHKNKYIYTKSLYKKSHTKIIITCKKHGDFIQLPSVHLNGSGCPKCVSIVSKPETEWLNYLNIKDRQKYIKPYKVDGIDYNNKIVYEFLGDYWHGNPKKFKSTDLNKHTKTTFGELLKKTFKKFDNIKKNGYSVKYVWESDWNKFKLNNDVLNIISYE